MNLEGKKTILLETTISFSFEKKKRLRVLRMDKLKMAIFFEIRRFKDTEILIQPAI